MKAPGSYMLVPLFFKIHKLKLIPSIRQFLIRMRKKQAEKHFLTDAK